MALQSTEIISILKKRSAPLVYFCANFSRGEGGCWEWNGMENSSGYGSYILWANGKSHGLLAHRIAWLIFFGTIDEKLCVCHKCDNKKCVNPDHLFLGTQSENLLDMDRKGRRIRNAPRGEKHHHAKLTEIQVLRIREEYKNRRPVYELAREFKLNRGTIHGIGTMRTWKHL